jgi:hypothetical protein
MRKVYNVKTLLWLIVHLHDLMVKSGLPWWEIYMLASASKALDLSFNFFLVTIENQKKENKGKETTPEQTLHPAH